jgi:hypothetical protein
MNGKYLAEISEERDLGDDSAGGFKLYQALLEIC